MRLTAALWMALALAAAPKHITTIAGTSTAGFSGDGGPGTSGQINNPYGLAVGPDGEAVRIIDLPGGARSAIARKTSRAGPGDGRDMFRRCGESERHPQCGGQSHFPGESSTTTRPGLRPP